MGREYFDFGYKHELPEELDFSKLLDCPHCRKPIPSDSTHCLYCGRPVYFNHSRKKSIILLVIVILLIFFLRLFF